MTFNLPNTMNLELPFGVVLPEVNELMFCYNQHMGSYMSIEDYFGDCLQHSDDDWVSPEDKEMAIANNSVWEAHWYPKTPIGSYKILACSLENLLRGLQKIAEELK